MKGTRFHLLSLSILSILVAQPASAITTVTGQVGTIEVVGSGGGAPGNYDFRVFLVTSGTICNGQNWAYINSYDANYSALVSSVLQAKSLGLTVTLFVSAVGSYCELTNFVF